MFGRKQSRSKRFVKLRMRVATLPKFCTPASVIEATKYLLILTDESIGGSIYRDAKGLYGVRQQQLHAQIMGQYVTDDHLLQELHSKWHQPECTVVCATDGGLKDQTGTSSYAIFFPHLTQPIVFGRSGEYQSTETSSGTRQELLGQLGIEYWLSKLEENWSGLVLRMR